MGASSVSTQVVYKPPSPEFEARLVQMKSKKIHKNLRKSVKIFSYWARSIGTYIDNCERLDKLKQILEEDQKLIEEKFQHSKLRGSTLKQANHSLEAGLRRKIERFNKGDQTLSIVVQLFFEEWKKNQLLQQLDVTDFEDISVESINDISDIILSDATSPNNTSHVKLKTFKDNIQVLTSDIKSYQRSIKSDVAIRREIKSTEEEIKEIQSQMTQIEEFKFDVESNNDDSTNFVAAEMGFLVEVQSERGCEKFVEYYHYPVTLPNKKTFCIYDIQNEAFNYFSVEKKYLYHGNYIVDDYIKHTTGTSNGRSQADPRNDYHSESVLFFLCQQKYFQEKMINKLINCLQRNKLKMTELKKLILEIHSSNNVCTECLKKAEYLINWKEQKNLTQENKGIHFLEYFMQVSFHEMLKKKVLGINPKLEFNPEVEIRFSYDKDYGRPVVPMKKKDLNFTSKELPCSFIMVQNEDNDLLDSHSKLYSRVLCNYSIITSGGAANIHRNYFYAYYKAAELAIIHGISQIQKVWLSKLYFQTFNSQSKIL